MSKSNFNDTISELARLLKTADSHYDVSGETGEDLVNSAHPGNTKVDVSSKTKENVVETIVEQQKRDIEVALKQPKGVYASLVALHGTLTKMGHADKLGGLKQAIVAIVKDAGAPDFKTQVEDYFKKYPKETAPQFQQKVKEYLAKYPSAIDFSGEEIAGLGFDVDTRKTMDFVGQQFPGIISDVDVSKQEPAPIAGGKDLAKGGTEAVRRWQESYNKHYKLQPNDVNYLKPDGAWGPNTQKAYERWGKDKRAEQIKGSI